MSLFYQLKFHNSCNISFLQGGSNMTGTDFCVTSRLQSRSYFNHLV